MMKLNLLKLNKNEVYLKFLTIFTNFHFFKISKFIKARKFTLVINSFYSNFYAH